MKHDDLTGEIVAQVWHKVAMVISITAAISGLGIFVTAGAGVLWHRWAVKQHQIEIDKIQGRPYIPS